MGTPENRRFPWALLFLVSAWALLFRGALFRGETFAERDLRSYYRPAKALLAPLWEASGGLPLWNPLFSSGQPFAANPEHEVFHPLTALFLVLPFESAFRAQVVLPPLAGGWAAFLLARTLRRSREASALGAVAWGFGGYLISTTNLLPILLAASILPAVLAFAIRCARRARASDLAGLSITTALVGLAGEPSTLLMLPLLVAAALAHERTRARRLRRASPFLPGLGLVLGLGLSAATLLPGLHHASKTIRVEGLAMDQAGEWSFPPVRVLELLFPQVMGHVDRADEAWYWGRDAYAGKRHPFLYSIYPGLGVTLLSIVGVLGGGRRLWPWLATAATGLLLAVGTHGPVWDLVRGLPVLSGLRYPEKFLLLLALPLLVVSLHGFDRTFGPGEARRRGLRVLLALVLGLALAAAAGISWADGLAPRPWVALGIAPHLEASFATVAVRDTLRVALLASGALAILALVRRRRLAALALVGLTTFDLASAGRAVIPTVPVASVAAPPPWLLPLLQSPPHGPLFHLAAEDPVRGRARGIAKPPIPAQWGLGMTLERDFDVTFLRSTELARRLFWDVVRQKPERMPALLERRSVSAIVKFRPGARVVDGVVLAPPGTRAPIELARASTPRRLVFAAERVEGLAAAEDWAAAVLAADDGLPGTVHLRDADARELPVRPSPARVTRLEARPGRVSFDVSARGPSDSVLAVNQTWDEGWSAAVNGVPARLLVADVSLSAIAVPPGRHRVELAYRDRWVATGLAASGASLLVLVAALLAIARRPPRDPEPGSGVPATPRTR